MSGSRTDGGGAPSLSQSGGSILLPRTGKADRSLSRAGCSRHFRGGRVPRLQGRVRRGIIGLALLVVTTLGPAGTASAQAPRPLPSFGLVFNDDADLSFVVPDRAQAEALLRANIAALADTPVRTLVYCVGMGGDLRRDFYTRIPFTLKTGFDLRESVRDFRGGTITYTYNAANRSPLPFFDPIYSARVLPYGFPRLETPSNRKFYEHFAANSAQFTENENTTYRNKVTASKVSKEIVSAVYLRGDVALFDRRLKLVGGLRAEQTNVTAAGPLTDLTRNFQRDASGRVIRNANGTPVPIVTNTNSLAYSQLTFIDRGAKTDKEYLRYFPSLNASFNLRDNLIARAAYYQSVGRPNFIQYSGGITLPDPDVPPSNSNRIVVNNAAIKAWQAETFTVRLERYFEGVGQVSLGAFRRQFENFFGATIFNATPEFLALYDLDAATYDPFDVQTQHNVPGRVRTQGLDFSYKQALTFLPRWARGVQVFANASAQRLLGDETASLAGFISRSGSWGVSLTRQKYNVRVNWNYRGRQRNAPITGAGIEPGTFNYSSKRLYVDVLGEYYFWKRVGFFVNLRNVGDATEDTQILGPSTPEHAQFRQRIDYASLWTIGIKGTF